MIRTTLAAACALAILAAPMRARDDDDAKAKAKKMQGTWTVTAAEKDGKKLDNADIKGKTIKVTEDKITCMKDGKTEEAYTYTLDTSGRQWTITLNGTEGEHKDKKLKGIVSLDGDTMKVCFSKPDQDAPTSFQTKDGQCCYTLTRQR